MTTTFLAWQNAIHFICTGCLFIGWAVCNILSYMVQCSYHEGQKC